MQLLCNLILIERLQNTFKNSFVSLRDHLMGSYNEESNFPFDIKELDVSLTCNFFKSKLPKQCKKSIYWNKNVK